MSEGARAEVVYGPKGSKVGAPIDKIKKYGWAKIKDKPGSFEWIDKSELFTDLQYQRSKRTEKKINDIASNWSWVTCGTLIVVIRDDKWWVVDGGTRKLAADKRSDIKKLPCMVYDLDDDLSQEAGAFVRINDSRTAVASHDRFKALIVYGDECAIGLNKLFESTGHKAGFHGGIKTIACLMTVWKLYKKDKQLLSDMWPLISDVNEECPVRDSVARSIFWAEFSARKSGLTLAENPYRTYLIKAGGEYLNKEIRKEVAIVGRGGPRVEANALIKLINKQKTKGKAKIGLLE